MNNGNGNSHHCHRCISGVLFREGPDIVCLACGWRLSFVIRHRAHQDYLAESIVARLLRGNTKRIDEVVNRDWQLVGLGH